MINKYKNKRKYILLYKKYCKEIPNLKNIFIAAGNGIKIAINSSDYSTEQIENYIKQGLGKDVNTW